MTKTRRPFRGAFAAAAAGIASLGACGGKAPPPPVTTTATVSERCPDLGKPDEIGAFDFASEYVLSRDAADKLKAAALAATEVNQLGEKLDAELGIACAQIAHDLGDRGDWRNGNDACAAALKAVRDARAKLGPNAVTQLVVRPPVCLVDASSMTKCASICDSSVPAEKAKSECAHKAGICDGSCEGICEARSPSKCDGVCTGACDGLVKGACGGRCRGQCDGRWTNGPCSGVCVGACERGAISGACKGQCAGSCNYAKPSICDGVCAGKCNVELSNPKCAVPLEVPQISTDCRARCELEAVNKTECSVPHVGFVATGARDRETADAMKTAVDKSFPALLKILYEVGDKGPSRIVNAQAVIDGARNGWKEMARSRGAVTAARSEAQLTKCFDEAFKQARAAAMIAKAGLDLAIAVRDEAKK